MPILPKFSRTSTFRFYKFTKTAIWQRAFSSILLQFLTGLLKYNFSEHLDLCTPFRKEGITHDLFKKGTKRCGRYQLLLYSKCKISMHLLRVLFAGRCTHTWQNSLPCLALNPLKNDQRCCYTQNKTSDISSKNEKL